MENKVIYLLDEMHIQYESVEHPAVFTMEEMESLHLNKIEYVAKNLFLRDDKKRNYYLLSVHKDKIINLKELRALLHSRPLSFASENDLMNLLGLTKGSLTPFGILNDKKHQVQVFLDNDFKNTIIGIHPNMNTSTIFLDSSDLVRIIEIYGNPIQYLTLK